MTFSKAVGTMVGLSYLKALSALTLALALALVLEIPFAAAETGKADCTLQPIVPGAGQENTKRAQDNFECLEAKFLDVTKRLTNFEKAFTNGVIAFDDNTLNQNKCPPGWDPFHEGRGRFIIGAGDPSQVMASGGPEWLNDETGETLKTRGYRLPGGSQRHKLTIAEMPEHRHGLKTILNEARLPQRAVIAPAIVRHPPEEDEPSNKKYWLHFYEGANSPHNNMPPYLALYFCKKD